MVVACTVRPLASKPPRLQPNNGWEVLSDPLDVWRVWQHLIGSAHILAVLFALLLALIWCTGLLIILSAPPPDWKDLLSNTTDSIGNDDA